jgi:hypothetical protein
VGGPGEDWYGFEALMTLLKQYEELANYCSGQGSFGVINKVRKKSDGQVR